MRLFAADYRKQYLAELRARGIRPQQVQDAAIVLVFVVTVVTALILYSVWT